MLIDGLSKAFDGKKVLDGFSLELVPGTITCLSGPSGCGKTTLMNILAGLLEQDEGTIYLSPDENGDVSYLFQEPRLLPWRTALENVALVVDGDEQKARRYLELVGLEGHLSKYPDQLSGGMKQRVALARAFAFPSGVLLMDEPFQGLDTALKSKLMKSFIRMWEAERKTVLWVTHDITEACLASDEIVCVSTSPMQVVRSFHVSQDRSGRTAQSMAGLGAQVYETLAGV